jgi:hypothetical protein
MHDLLHWVAWIYAVYFLLTGIWPVVHMRSFLAVTGPKTDLWLVRTVGLMITAVGLCIGVAAWRHQIQLSSLVLAMASSGFLFLVDVIYVSKRVISRIYLLDAAIELILILGWVIGWGSGA